MKKLTTLAATAVIAGLGTIALADDHADPIKMRQETMKSIGGAMKVLSDMSKGNTDFDAAAANAALDTMTQAAETIPTVFETEAVDPESDASDDIWANWDDFVTKAEALHTAAMGAEVTDEASVGAAMGAVGEACAACHKPYKL